MSQEGEIETRKLPCQLSPSEREAKTAELVRLEQNEQHRKAEKKETVASLNAGLKLVRESIDQIVKELDEGAEVREVEVETVYLYSENRVDYVRRDTQEVVSSREMDAFDRQESLPDEDLSPSPSKPQKRARKKHGQLRDVSAPGAE